MSSGSSGAVFFLGTRAHYQVLDQPESRFDSENGNTSTETIYQNSGKVQELWPKAQTSMSTEDADDRRNWNYEQDDVTVIHEKEPGVGVKRRIKRRQSEAALCEDEMRPAVLNIVEDNEIKPKPSRRVTLMSFLASLARRKRRHDTDHAQYLRHLESALTSCTYRESCRCLECQSRYFECDESEDYSSDESEYTPRYTLQPEPLLEHDNEDSDDEVFINSVPGDNDNTSTDLLIGGNEKMSVSSDTLDEGDEEAGLELAAGTPVLLNYLLTHPITCVIQ